MGPMIPKEMKYNLHYGNIRGDFLPPPHGTNTTMCTTENTEAQRKKKNAIDGALERSVEKKNTVRLESDADPVCSHRGSVIYLITKTYLYNSDPLKPHFYIVNLGFIGVYIIFLISA